MKRFLPALVTALLLGAHVPGQAHHSFAAEFERAHGHARRRPPGVCGLLVRDESLGFERYSGHSAQAATRPASIIGFRYAQTVSAICVAPAVFGWMPSEPFISRTSATPWSRNGTSGTEYCRASRGKIS